MITKILRLLGREILQFSPEVLRRAAVRVPFSRFHKIASYLFWGEEKINWRGVNIKVNPGEVHGYYPYFLGDYSKEEVEKLIELCEKARIFADVGANTGMISFALARANPQLKVFAFEPDRDVVKRFLDNLRLNPDLSNRVYLFENAVSDVNGNLLFQPSLDFSNPEVGRLVTDEKQNLKAYAVPSIRLDSFFNSIEEYPEVAKIDVEGSELRVLEGMSGLFSKGFPKAMLIEVHPFYFSHDVMAFKTKVETILKQISYNLFWHDGNDWKSLIPPEDWPSRLHLLAIRNGEI